MFRRRRKRSSNERPDAQRVEGEVLELEDDALDFVVGGGIATSPLGVRPTRPVLQGLGSCPLGVTAGAGGAGRDR